MRKKTLRAAALNITISPHPNSDVYVEAFQFLHVHETIATIRGSRAGLVRSFIQEKDCCYGVFALFTQFDARSWLSLKSRDEATTEELNQISIPSHLKPEYSPVEFVLFPENHTLIFSCTSLSPNSAKILVENLFEKSGLLARYDNVAVNIFQDHQQLESMLNDDKIVEMTIEIDLTNPDSGKSIEKQIYDELVKANGSSITQTITAQNGKFLKPTDRIAKTAKAALRNGRVQTKVKTDGRSVIKRSTTDEPKKVVEFFNPMVQTVFGVLASLLKKFI